MVKSTAEICRAYRQRLKEKDREGYLKKERERRKESYVPSALLSKKERQERNMKNSIVLKRHRQKKKLLSNTVVKSEVVDETTDDDVETISNNEERFVVVFPFPIKSLGSAGNYKKTNFRVTSKNTELKIKVKTETNISEFEGNSSIGVTWGDIMTRV